MAGRQHKTYGIFSFAPGPRFREHADRARDSNRAVLEREHGGNDDRAGRAIRQPVSSVVVERGAYRRGSASDRLHVRVDDPEMTFESRSGSRRSSTCRAGISVHACRRARRRDGRRRKLGRRTRPTRNRGRSGHESSHSMKGCPQHSPSSPSLTILESRHFDRDGSRANRPARRRRAPDRDADTGSPSSRTWS